MKIAKVLFVAGALVAVSSASVARQAGSREVSLKANKDNSNKTTAEINNDYVSGGCSCTGTGSHYLDCSSSYYFSLDYTTSRSCSGSCTWTFYSDCDDETLTVDWSTFDLRSGDRIKVYNNDLTYHSPTDTCYSESICWSDYTYTGTMQIQFTPGSSSEFSPLGISATVTSSYYVYSGGAIAGITFGCVFLFLFIILLPVFVVRRRQIRVTRCLPNPVIIPAQQQAPTIAYTYPPPPMYTNPGMGQSQPYLQAMNQQQPPAYPAAQQMPSSTNPFEKN